MYYVLGMYSHCTNTQVPHSPCRGRKKKIILKKKELILAIIAAVAAAAAAGHPCVLSSTTQNPPLFVLLSGILTTAPCNETLQISTLPVCKNNFTDWLGSLWMHPRSFDSARVSIITHLRAGLLQYSSPKNPVFISSPTWIGTRNSKTLSWIMHCSVESLLIVMLPFSVPQSPPNLPAHLPAC